MTSTFESILKLNDVCLLEVSKHLDIHDTINLAKTCHHWKDVAEKMLFKRYTELTVNRSMLMNGHISDVLSHVGQYVETLKCNLNGVNGELEKRFWSAVNNKCKCLKSIVIELWSEQTVQNFTDFDCFKSVEKLDLDECTLRTGSKFSLSFRNLKHLCCSNSLTEADLKALFKSNSNLIALSYMGRMGMGSTIRCFEMVPKIEALRTAIPYVPDYETLINFNNLKKLDLWCEYRNINDLLIRLANKGIIEELDLSMILCDQRTFEILKRFTKLQLLSIENLSGITIKPTTNWPPNLKYLALEDFKISVETLLSTIKQLKVLEKIDLFSCGCIKRELRKFNDLNYLSGQIFKVMDQRDPQQLLIVTLPQDVDCDKDNSEVH